MKYVTLLLTLALIAGCKASVIPEESTTVAASRIYSFSKKSDAHLVVVDKAFLGMGCTIRISIDGKPAADFFFAEVAHFGLTIGSHNLSARSTEGCLMNWMQEAKVRVKAGDALIIHINEAGLTPVEL